MGAADRLVCGAGPGDQAGLVEAWPHLPHGDQDTPQVPQPLQDPEAPGSFEALLGTFTLLGEEAVACLLEAAMVAIQGGLGEVFTEEWKQGGSPGDHLSHVTRSQVITCHLTPVARCR